MTEQFEIEETVFTAQEIKEAAITAGCTIEEAEKFKHIYQTELLSPNSIGAVHETGFTCKSASSANVDSAQDVMDLTELFQALNASQRSVYSAALDAGCTVEAAQNYFNIQELADLYGTRVISVEQYCAGEAAVEADAL